CDLIENYEKFSAYYFAEKYGVNLHIVYGLASKLNLSRNNKWEKDAEKIIEEYLSGKGVAQIAKKYKHGSRNVRQFLVDKGIELKTHSDWAQRHDFDKEFFKRIDSHEKAYWLGVYLC